MLVASLADMGNLEESRAELETMLEVHPDFTPAKLDRYMFADEADRERIIAGIRTAGLRTRPYAGFVHRLPRHVDGNGAQSPGTRGSR